jgi:hypothetical protein
MYLAPVREAAERWVLPHWRRPAVASEPPHAEAGRGGDTTNAPTDALVQA